jgi:DNA-binding MarR family transcriptional regulator
MMALWEQKSATINELQNLTKIDGGSLTNIIKKLLDKEYILMTPHPTDKRVKQISLSKSGISLKSRALSIPKTLLCNMKEIDKQDLQDLIRILDKINTNFS